jgi:hypothetical protein
MDDTLAVTVVAQELVETYPDWVDEHGTNVEQLAAIAVHALRQHGLLPASRSDAVTTQGS